MPHELKNKVIRNETQKEKRQREKDKNDQVEFIIGMQGLINI